MLEYIPPLRNKRRYKKDSILYILEKYNKYLSPAFRKFLKIRGLLSPQYIIYKRYIESIHYQTLVKEIELEASKYRKCIVCGKAILIHENEGKSNLSFIFSKKLTCSCSCLGKYGAKKYHTEKTRQKEEERLKKIHNTMIKKYGAPTTLQCPLLKAKVQKTNQERYGCISPASNKEVAKKISNKLKGKKHV